MKVLFLDLASHNGCLAVCSETSVLAWSDCDNRLSDSALLPLVEQTLKSAKIEYKDLTHVACVVGPGGFTSLRVAVTLANVLADQLKIPLVGVHLSDLYFALHHPQPPPPPVEEEGVHPASRGAGVVEGNVFWIHSTKKEEVFLRGAHITEPTWMKLSEVLSLMKKGDHWMGELIDAQKAQVEELGVTEAELAPLQGVLPEFLAHLSYSDKQLEPWYGRGF